MVILCFKHDVYEYGGVGPSIQQQGDLWSLEKSLGVQAVKLFQ